MINIINLYFIENNSFEYYKFFEINYLISFFFVFVIISRRKGVFSLFSIFLITYFAFIGSKLFLDVFDVISVFDTYLFYFTKLNIDTIQIFIYINHSLLIAVSIISLIHKDQKQRFDITTQKEVYDFLISKFKIISPFVIILNIYSLVLIINSGNYLAIFNGEFEGDFLYSISNYFQLLYNIFYIILIASSKNVKELSNPSKIFFINLLIYSVRGQRGPMLIYLLLFLYQRNKIKRINLNKILVPFFALLLFFIAIEYIRTSESRKSNFDFNQFKFISLPAEVSLFMIEFNKVSFINDSTPYILTPIKDYFNRLFHLVDPNIFYQGRTITLLKNSNYLSHQLMFFLSKESFYAGFGTGSSLIAEVYDLVGYRYSLLAYLFFFLIIAKIENSSRKTMLMNLIFIVVFMSFIYSPRDSILKFFQNLVPLILVYTFTKSYLKINEKRISS